MEENTNWSQSVGCVVMRDGKVLLGRHTYGVGKGKLILPGGYLQFGELPQEAAKREVLEETGVCVEVGNMLGIRCTRKAWYLIFYAEYVSGTAHPNDDENSEVVWMDAEEAMTREDVPDLTKAAIDCVCKRMEHTYQSEKYQENPNTEYEYYTAGR